MSLQQTKGHVDHFFIASLERRADMRAGLFAKQFGQGFHGGDLHQPDRVIKQTGDGRGLVRPANLSQAAHRRGSYPEIFIGKGQSQPVHGLVVTAGPENFRGNAPHFDILVGQCQLNGQQMPAGARSAKSLQGHPSDRCGRILERHGQLRRSVLRVEATQHTDRRAPAGCVGIAKDRYDRRQNFRGKTSAQYGQGLNGSTPDLGVAMTKRVRQGHQLADAAETLERTGCHLNLPSIFAGEYRSQERRALRAPGLSIDIGQAGTLPRRAKLPRLENGRRLFSGDLQQCHQDIILQSFIGELVEKWQHRPRSRQPAEDPHRCPEQRRRLVLLEIGKDRGDCRGGAQLRQGRANRFRISVGKLGQGQQAGIPDVAHRISQTGQQLGDTGRITDNAEAIDQGLAQELLIAEGPQAFQGDRHADLAKRLEDGETQQHVGRVHGIKQCRHGFRRTQLAEILRGRGPNIAIVIGEGQQQVGDGGWIGNFTKNVDDEFTNIVIRTDESGRQASARQPAPGAPEYQPPYCAVPHSPRHAAVQQFHRPARG